MAITVTQAKWCVMLVQLSVTQKAKRIVLKKSNVIDFMGFVLGGFFLIDIEFLELIEK